MGAIATWSASKRHNDPVPSYIDDFDSLIAHGLEQLLHIPVQVLTPIGTVLAALTYYSLFLSLRQSAHRVLSLTQWILRSRSRTLRSGGVILPLATIGLVLSIVAAMQVCLATVQLVVAGSETQTLALSAFPSYLLDGARSEWVAPTVVGLVLVVIGFVVGVLARIRSLAVVAGCCGALVFLASVIATTTAGSLLALLVIATLSHADLAAEDLTPVIALVTILSSTACLSCVGILRWTFRISRSRELS